jgi:hypothetical protein
MEDVREEAYMVTSRVYSISTSEHISTLLEKLAGGASKGRNR